jgi:hypothetical protein
MEDRMQVDQLPNSISQGAAAQRRSDAWAWAAAMIRPEDDALLRQLAAMNLEIVEARKRLEAARSELSDARSSRVLKRFEEKLTEMLRQRSEIMGQLNRRSRTWVGDSGQVIPGGMHGDRWQVSFRGQDRD